MSSSSERKIGRYQVKKKLGEGAMAIVVLAYDPVFKRDVALKVLHRHLARNDDIRKRFLREARAIAQIDHPAIVPIYDAGQDGSFVYYVMRMMEGETLFDRVSERALTAAEIMPIMERVTSALDAAHENGFVHRDVKPENILFDRYDAAYLADFGILKQSDTDANLTQNKLLGTPAYMSPEQVRGEEVTARSDVYSLGAVLFEMLTGELPYQADTAMSMAMKHVTDPVPRLRERNTKLSKQVEQIVAKAMAKDPSDRYESGGELLAALNGLRQPGTRTTSNGDILLPQTRSRQRLWIGLIGLLLLGSLGWGAYSIFAGGESPAELTPDAAEIAGLTATAQHFAEQSDLLYTQEAIYLEQTVTAVYESAIADAGGGAGGVETAVAATLQALEALAPAETPTLEPSETPVPTETATPSPTDTLEPTEVPTEEPTVEVTEESAEIPQPPMLVVRTSSANARQGPGTAYTIVAVVLADEVYEIIGRNNASDWYEVVLKNGQIGWIAASAALVDPEAADVPLGNIPPVPTNTRVAVRTATPNFAATQTRVADQTRAAGQAQVQLTQTRQAQVNNFNATQTAQANATRQAATRNAQAQATNAAGTATAAANAAAWNATQTAQARPTNTPRPTATPRPSATPTRAVTSTPVPPTSTPIPPTKESTGPLELFFSFGSCRYEGIDYLCDLSLTAKGGSGGPYTISVFDAEPPKEYTTSGTVVHVFRSRRCAPWIHEVRVLDTSTQTK